jgi:HAMP domain-containing protein
VWLAVFVVVAAGTAGTTHFKGARWVPRLRIAVHSAARQRSAIAPPVSSPATSAKPVAVKFPLGTVALWTVVTIVVLGAAFLFWRWWEGRPSRAARSRHAVAVQAAAAVTSAPGVEPEPDVPVLRTGIERALELLDEQREPGDAIVRAWLGLQETAEQAGIVRQPAETPTEFTARIMGRAFGDDRAIATLLRLYLRTRFGDRPVTTDDVDAVRAALTELIRTWPAPSGSQTGAGVS